MSIAASVYLVSLGCPKNRVDSEIILGRLAAHGVRIVDSPEEAELLLVNTCGFIQPAVEEGIDTILELARFKEQDPAKRLVVAGCMVQRYGEKLAQELPEVDLFLGTEAVADIVTAWTTLAKQGPLPLVAPSLRTLPHAGLPRVLSAPPHRAYLKVTEGCSNRCSYCLIPMIRGELRSRPVDDLVREAQRLDDAGVRELTLVAQDLTAYGRDLGPASPGLSALLASLLQHTAIPWIRLLYLHPARLDEPLLELMAREDRLLPYLDIPLQHVSSRILAAMNRPYDEERCRKTVEMIRRHLPGAAIRTTLMVGFPGEQEEDVALLERFLEEYRLDHVGVFSYSNEEECRAATFSGQVSEEEKEARKNRLLALQAAISEEKNRQMVGRIEPVLVEGVSRETELLLEGRTRFQAPEIDGVVWINAGECRAGEIVQVRITEAHPYDLVGEIV